MKSFLPRLFLLETEYQGALMVAELGWGKLVWHEEWLREVSAKMDAPDGAR